VCISDPLKVIQPQGSFSILSDEIELPWSPQELAKISHAHSADPSKGYDSLVRPFKVPGIAGAHL
jgi:hypothetical protein